MNPFSREPYWTIHNNTSATPHDMQKNASEPILLLWQS